MDGTSSHRSTAAKLAPMKPETTAKLCHRTAALLTRLPWSWQRRLADGVAWLWRRIDARWWTLPERKTIPRTVLDRIDAHVKTMIPILTG